ncbi:MAG: Helix-turn-helix domain protein [Acidimicrobiales bacterium]|nr:Helix-turn-helix domain protein [Acidimicrobiales bacterium]
MDRFLLRPEDAAHALSIGRSKLYELIASGRLASVMIDGCRRIRVEDVEAFVASLTAEPIASHPASIVDLGHEPSGAIDLPVEQPLLFPDMPARARRGRPDS